MRKTSSLTRLPLRTRSAVKSLKTTEEIVKHHPEVFQQELVTLPATVHLEVDQNVTPVVAPPRRVPASLKGKLKQELDRLDHEKTGVVTPIDKPTPWVSGLAVAVKTNGALRMYRDLRPLNIALEEKGISCWFEKIYCPSYAGYRHCVRYTG